MDSLSKKEKYWIEKTSPQAGSVESEVGDF
jgi:hypothetical protein